MRKNIILCGVGGQGTVLASRLISSAAMARRIPVLSAETIGMAQRGGSVFSHLRMGEGLYSPMIARHEADLMIAFEPGEAVRLLPFLKQDGRMIVSSRAVMPVTAALSGTGYRPEEMLAYLSSRVAGLTAGSRFTEGAEPDPAGRRIAERRPGPGSGRPEAGCPPADP